MSVQRLSPHLKANPAPSPLDARTQGALLESIRSYLCNDGAYVPPDSVDSGGLTVIADGQLYRLELSYEGLQDDADWRRLEDLRFNRWIARDESIEHDVDWMADTGDDIPF